MDGSAASFRSLHCCLPAAGAGPRKSAWIVLVVAGGVAPRTADERARDTSSASAPDGSRSRPPHLGKGSRSLARSRGTKAAPASVEDGTPNSPRGRHLTNTIGSSAFHSRRRNSSWVLASNDTFVLASPLVCRRTYPALSSSLNCLSWFNNLRKIWAMYIASQQCAYERAEVTNII
jgi:hypothetical protein